jgi:hypothetical protein
LTTPHQAIALVPFAANPNPRIAPIVVWVVDTAHYK